jgi:hypothetical protein
MMAGLTGAVVAVLACLMTLATVLGSSPARAQAAGEWRSAQQLWSGSCRYCHNDRVAGELRGTHLSPAAIITAVRAGIGGMPSFAPSTVSDTELEQLARWLTSPPQPAPADGEARTPRHATRERPQ